MQPGPVVAASLLQPREATAPTLDRPSPATPPKLIIGIGAFDAGGVAADHGYLVQGFRRELIANLVRFREWGVRDGAVAVPNGTSLHLGHEYLAEASALQAGHGVRLVVTLRDMRTHEYVWSDEYSLTVASWSETQQRLVHRIATALNVYLSAGRISGVNYQPNQNLNAYDRWLFGQSKLHLWDPTSFHEAVAIFRSIISDAPKFSPAYSTLAQLQNIVHFVHPGVLRSTPRTEEALRYAQEAARLDPVDSRAQLALGWAYAMAKQHDLAGVHHGLAQELNENDPWTATSVALGLAARGELEQARAAADHALQLGFGLGGHHWGYQLQVRFVARDYEASLQAAGPAGNLIPTSPAWKMAALGHAGYKQEARAEYEKFVADVRSKWFGSEPPTEENIARWALHVFPFKRHEDWEHFRDGLAAAGMPVSGLTHDVW